MTKQTTFTLGEDEIKQAIVEYLDKREKADIVIENIELRLDNTQGEFSAVADSDDIRV
jgi:hypothetical protein